MTLIETSEGRGMGTEAVSANDEEVERALADTINGREGGGVIFGNDSGLSRPVTRIP